MSAYNTAACDISREQAKAASFAEVLEKAKRAAEPKNILSRAERKLTAEEQEALQDKKLREACQGFEAMFMELMYKEMRGTVPEDTLFGESNAHKIWQSMLDSELMQESAKAGGVGLADMLYEQLKPSVQANRVDRGV